MHKKILKWDDGDSGLFSNGQRFRLSRVRAPESYQFGGSTALKRAAGMSGRSGNIVGTKIVGRDSFNRLLVELSNKDGSINKRLIQRGCRNKGR